MLRKVKWAPLVLAAALILMIVSAAVGHGIQTSGGTVRTEEITFTTDVGAESHAKLYIPATATAETPAPAILLCHGYTASLDAMEPNAIELSRRGYVVMCLDEYGHGESTLPPSGYSQAEMGGVEDYAPDLGTYSALQQFAQYDFVDLTKIGMLGHSMGTAAIQEGPTWPTPSGRPSTPPPSPRLWPPARTRPPPPAPPIWPPCPPASSFPAPWCSPATTTMCATSTI